MRAHFAEGYESPRNNWQRTDKWTLKYATAITSYEHISPLTADKLNIKFAPNGTGKSTLSRAISCAARDDIQGLQALMPFRLRGENPDSTGPIVIGADGIGGRDVLQRGVRQSVYVPTGRAHQ